MKDYYLNQTGPEVQGILDQVGPNKEAIDVLEEGAQTETEQRSEKDIDLQRQIDEIVVGGATFALNATPLSVFVGQSSTINLTASASVIAEHIAISKGGTLISEGEGTSLTGNDTITPQGDSTITYKADFLVRGVAKSVNRSVTAVRPIFYGEGSRPEDATTQVTSPRTSPAGTYTVPVATGGSYVYFKIPNNMSINKATLSGFDFPLLPPDTTVMAGYKVYRSQNTYDAGTLTIVIS